MQNVWHTFFNEPNGRNYLRVRQRILKYRRKPQIEELSHIQALFEQGEYQLVRLEAARLLPRWGLSPRLYRLTGLAAWELKDLEAAELDKFLFDACLQGILATGEGTVSLPYWVIYPSDPDELLDRLGLKIKRRFLMRATCGPAERVDSEDGRSWWFTYQPAELRRRVWWNPEPLSAVSR